MSRNPRTVISANLSFVTPREGRVSINEKIEAFYTGKIVTPREGRVSRNAVGINFFLHIYVTPREGRVSRNRGRQ